MKNAHHSIAGDLRGKGGEFVAGACVAAKCIAQVIRVGLGAFMHNYVILAYINAFKLLTLSAYLLYKS